MSLTRKLMLLAGMALAAIAFSATPAAAQETDVEIDAEATGNPCNPCQIHAEGESHIRNLLSGSIISRCHDDFTGTINHNGTGELRWTGTQHTGTACSTNCAATPTDESHWPISNAGETGADTGHMTVRFCVNPPGFVGDSHCDAEVQVQETSPGTHHHFFSTAQICSGGATRVEGSWEQEALPHDPDPDHVEIEVVHL